MRIVDSWWNGHLRRVQLCSDGTRWEVRLRQGAGAGIRPWIKPCDSEAEARAYIADVLARSGDQWRQNPPGFIQ